MVQYKVFRWQFSAYDSDDDKNLEDNLNDLASNGWKVINIITNNKKSGSLMVGDSEDSSRSIFILEKTIN
ncbi:DUF4177 domain-containing protein [Clostridium folliculivorans]|uniref:DUF4177 domain-containing protein n=1 Tax=Clostridium folliculivorans TaxID=2886038 RepID=A0A9W5Y6J7_9CLOT|nr:DUF4177 domain-containing protein [Clostridium folliculivorans]GKU27312.1 hypothetical protein CFOLD11_41390 [Clostridium folliculivorans]GKU32163.1 hypothetical protein CFB3_42710 [Clostridium folliculivorans]